MGGAKETFVDRVATLLSPATAKAYARCLANPLGEVATLEHETRSYLKQVEDRATEAEFLDLETARTAAEGCLTLIERLGCSPNVARQRAVQAAVDYFVEEDDGENDNSIVGFDDDLEVVRVTAEVLGWPISEDTA